MPETKKKRTTIDASGGETRGQDHLSDPMEIIESDSTKTVWAGEEIGRGLHVSTVGSDHEAHDGASTTRLYTWLSKKYPKASEKELWTWAVQYDVNPGGMVADIREGGDDDPEVGDGGNKHAFIVGNSNYPKPWKDLPGAERDAKAMESRYKSLGYSVTANYNEGTGAMGLTYYGASYEPSPGDDVVMYYAGHGVKNALIGTDGKWFPHSRLKDAQGKALKGGANATLIMDACNSASSNEDEDYDGMDLDGVTTADLDLPDYDAGVATWMSEFGNSPEELKEFYKERLEQKVKP